jgi:hypothetical protein
MISIRAWTAALALTLVSVPASAQTDSLFQPADREMLGKFRPSMDAVTRCNQAAKALAAAARKDARLKAELADDHFKNDVGDSTIEQTLKEVEKQAPMASAMMARNGCPVRDFFLLSFQSMVVKMSATPELQKMLGGTKFLPAETAAFWQKNGAAADRLLEEASKAIDLGKK